MSNKKYEFNIEDINIVVVKDKTSSYNYKTVYTRDALAIGEEPTFIESPYADPIVGENGVEIICNRCGVWNSYSHDEYIDETFDSKKCPNCDEHMKITHTENEMIDIIMSFMDKEIFESIELTINDILIK